MERISEFVDERQKSWCIHCGGSVRALPLSRDHVPSRALLRKPHPANLPTVKICKECNSSFSQDEEYMAAFLGCVLAGSTELSDQDDKQTARILGSNAKLKSRIVNSQTTYNTVGGDMRCVWRPEQDRINNVILKNARGHAYFEIGEPMLSPPARIWSLPFQALTSEERAQFEDIDMGLFLPEVGSRMLTRVITGQDLCGSWVVVQDGVYRYGVAQSYGMLVRTVLYEYLATEVYWPA